MLQRVGQCLTGAAAPSGWPKLAAVLARCFALQQQQQQQQQVLILLIKALLRRY
jgi:hypothetical protein